MNSVMEAVLAQRLEDTYREERGKLLGFIRSRIPDLEDAEDVLQEVFAQTIENLNVAQPIDNLLAWIFRSVRNRIIDLYRRKKQRPLSLEGTADKVTFEDLLADSGISIEEDFIRNRVREALEEALDELPDNQRDVFLLQAVEGKPFREITEMTGISINTLLARKRYAVQFMRKRLSEIKELLDELK